MRKPDQIRVRVKAPAGVLDNAVEQQQFAIGNLGVLPDGRACDIILDYSAKPESFVPLYKSGAELISGKRIAQAAAVTLQPWNLAIIEEQE